MSLACGGTRYVVAKLEPRSMEFQIIAYADPDPYFNGVSAARIVWLSHITRDRLAYRPLPGLATTLIYP